MITPFTSQAIAQTGRTLHAPAPRALLPRHMARHHRQVKAPKRLVVGGAAVSLLVGHVFCEEPCRRRLRQAVLWRAGERRDSRRRQWRWQPRHTHLRKPRLVVSDARCVERAHGGRWPASRTRGLGDGPFLLKGQPPRRLDLVVHAAQLFGHLLEPARHLTQRVCVDHPLDFLGRCVVPEEGGRGGLVS